MKSKILIITLGLMLVICFGCSRTAIEPAKFKPGSEPDGFMGVKWGTDIATLSGMKYLKTTRFGGKVYSKIPEDLKIEGVNFKKISYCFQGDKFGTVEAFTSGYFNCLKLEIALFRKFGLVREAYEHRMYYRSWQGEKTLIILSYNKSRKMVHLFVSIIGK